jgi:trimethylamine-N-oxide reductase (cytochrome c)
MEPVERLNGEGAKYSFHVNSAHPNSRLHSQLCGTSLRETYAVSGREPCMINPADAEAKGIVDGDIVRIFNDRGQVLAGAVVSDEVRPNVIKLSEGGWYDPVPGGELGALDVYGDVNNLTVGIGTSKLAQGNCGHTALADIEKYTGDAPAPNVFTAPAEG